LGVGGIGHCDDVYTLKLRDFDAPMSGALYLTHRNPDLTKLYKEGEEIECYVHPSEALRKISFYLKNPLQLECLANAGYQRALKEHTWNQRLLRTFVQLGLVEPTTSSRHSVKN
jgi:spore maturation protein CgeB